MQFIVKDRVIYKDVVEILYDLQSFNRLGKLRTIDDRGDEIRIPCPKHSEGKEKTPSCFIRKSDFTWHCFACGASGGIAKFVGEVFNRNKEYGEDWLIAHYASDYINQNLILDKIDLNINKIENKKIDESILDTFESYHPYMTQRHLTKEVIDKYGIKYDPSTECIVFPVRDINGNLSYLTRRSVEGKRFIIDKNANKSDIYLLNYVKNEKTVFIVEAQLSALVMNGWGLPTISLLGAGTSEEQMNTLNNTSIRRFILCYDQDKAGIHGMNRFKKLINKDRFIDVITLPIGKDPNDLTEDEFKKIISLQLPDYSV